jgi:hypothetical protein
LRGINLNTLNCFSIQDSYGVPSGIDEMAATARQRERFVFSLYGMYIEILTPAKATVILDASLGSATEVVLPKNWV